MFARCCNQSLWGGWLKVQRMVHYILWQEGRGLFMKGTSFLLYITSVFVLWCISIGPTSQIWSLLNWLFDFFRFHVTYWLKRNYWWMKCFKLGWGMKSDAKNLNYCENLVKLKKWILFIGAVVDITGWSSCLPFDGLFNLSNWNLFNRSSCVILVDEVAIFL